MIRKFNLGLKGLALAVGTAVLGSQAFADNVTINSDGSETLTFGGQVNATPINSFFNGGTDGFGTAGGVANNVGITFSSVAQFKNPGFNGTGFGGGNGEFENAPGGATGVLFLSASPSTTTAILDDAGGFNAASLNYSVLGNLSSSAGGTVDFWSGLDGTGTLLGSLSLGVSSNPVACTGAHDQFCSWSTGSLALSSTAESMTFVGNARAFTEFSQVTVAPVPLPAALWLMLSGLGGLGAMIRRRQAA